MKPLLERFNDKCTKTDTCWIWTGAVHRQGYGRIRRGFKEGKTIQAHRAAYELFKGEIPLSMFVCHTCDNPSCVNPDHLFLGTIEENTEDMVRKGRAAKGIDRPNVKLTESEVIEIREKYATGNYSQRQLGKIYDIGYTNIYSITKGKTWGHLKNQTPHPAKE